MSADLSQFRDHARAMSTAQHKPECLMQRARARWNLKPPPPPCPGCVTDSDRALWRSLADEADAYLTTDDEGLFA